MQSRFYIKQKICMSHLDPEGGRLLAHYKAKRLTRLLKWAKSMRIPAVMVTCTYDHRAWGWPDDDHAPQKLYEAAERNQHAARFMQRLEEYLQEDLRGKWVRKAEFQRGGWLHYHFIILGIAFIPHDDLTRIWSHGHVDIRRVSKKTGHYVAKYQSKAGEGYPDFLYDRPRNSVKIWGTSPGFWKPVEDRESVAEGENPSDAVNKESDNGEDDCVASPRHARRMRRYLDATDRRSAAVWEIESGGKETIREVMQRTYRTVSGHDGRGNRVDIEDIDIGSVVASLYEMGLRLSGVRWGFLEFPGTMNDLVEAGRRARAADRARRWSSSGLGPEGAEPDVYLNTYTRSCIRPRRLARRDRPAGRSGGRKLFDSGTLLKGNQCDK